MLTPPVLLQFSGLVHQPRNLLLRYVTRHIRAWKVWNPSSIFGGKRAQRVTSSDRFSPEDFDQPTLSGPAGQRTLGQALDEYDAAPPARRESMELKVLSPESIVRLSMVIRKGFRSSEDETVISASTTVREQV